MSENEIVQHPGKLLLSEIGKLGMSQKELAIRTGVSEKHISTVINGTKDISASFARRIDIALGAESGTWARHQAEYDQYSIRLEEENGITDDEIAILKNLKEIIDFFLETGTIHNHCGDAEKVLQFRQILRVNDLTAIPHITYNAAYRAQLRNSTSIDPYVLFAWQRMCELITDKIPVDSSFERDKLIGRLPNIKEQMFLSDVNQMIKNLRSIFAECGIAFAVVYHFKGAPVQGFIKQADSGKVILCLTIRGKAADIFWFSLFHEIGHLINGDINTRFVDFDSVKDGMEAKADMFARDVLIAPELYRSFIESDKYHSLDDIKTFSMIAGVPYWITIGRLHKDGWLDWSRFAHETPSFVCKKV